MQGKLLVEHWADFKEQAERRKNRGTPEFPTGIKYLDELTDGIHKGEMWSISGRSGAGKTSLALQIGRNIADNPKNSVLFISLEMKGRELVGRMFSEAMHEEYDQMKIGNFPVNFERKEKTFLGIIGGIDFEIVERGYTFKEVEDIIKNHYPNKKPDVIVIDFAQCIEWEKFKDQRLAMESYVRKLTELSKTLDIAIILISQLRRLPSGADYNREPDMMDLKGSGSLEQLSDVVVLINKSIKNNEEHYWLRVAKNRHGATGRIEIEFVGSQYRFKEHDALAYKD